MIGTEEEARQWWCPMARVYAKGPESVVNRWRDHDNGKHLANCIASKCAMWRWSTLPSGARTYGYCGLAGNPKG